MQGPVTFRRSPEQDTCRVWGDGPSPSPLAEAQFCVHFAELFKALSLRQWSRKLHLCVLQRLASVAINLRNAFGFGCCCCGLHFCRKRCGLNKSTITSVALLLLCSSQRVSSEHFSFFFERRGQLFGHLCNGVATWDGEALVKLALQVQTRCPCLFEHSQNKTTHCSVRGVRGQITQGQIMIRDPLTRGEEGGREHLTSR